MGSDLLHMEKRGVSSAIGKYMLRGWFGLRHKDHMSTIYFEQSYLLYLLMHILFTDKCKMGGHQ